MTDSQILRRYLRCLAGGCRCWMRRSTAYSHAPKLHALLSPPLKASTDTAFLSSSPPRLLLRTPTFELRSLYIFAIRSTLSTLLPFKHSFLLLSFLGRSIRFDSIGDWWCGSEQRRYATRFGLTPWNSLALSDRLAKVRQNESTVLFRDKPLCAQTRSAETNTNDGSRERDRHANTRAVHGKSRVESNRVKVEKSASIRKAVSRSLRQKSTRVISHACLLLVEKFQQAS